MPLIKLPIVPGINRDDSELVNEGGWAAGSWTRFVADGKKGLPELVGGYQRASNDTFRGIARSILSWETLANEKLVAVGTHKGIFALRDGQLQDITPERSTGSFGTNPLSTTSGDATVTVTLASHGAIDGARVYVTGLTATGGVTIGGGSGNFAASPFQTFDGARRVTVTLTGHGLSTGDYCTISGVTGTLNGIGATDFNKRHTVYVLSVDTFQIDVETEATGTGAGGGGTPAYALYYGYDVTYVDANTFTIEAASDASSAATGGGAGGAYVFAVNPGQQHTIATAGYGTGTYGRGFYGVGQTADELLARTIASQAYGEQALFNIRGGGLYRFLNNFSDRAALLSEPPQKMNAVLVDPVRRFVFALGCSNVGSAADFDELKIRWCRVGGLDGAGDWTPSATSSAGSFDPLGEGRRIMNGVALPFVNLVWTDTAVYQILYRGQAPNAVWDLQLLGDGCGLVGPNAFARIGGGVIWASPSRQFWRWEPGLPSPIEVTCPVKNHLFDNLATQQEFKISGGTNGQFSEAWFWYPHDTNECDRYVAFNYRLGVWTDGIKGRSAWIDRGVLASPVAAGTDGLLYTHEKGNSADGQALTGFIESARYDLGDGDNELYLDRIITDMKGQVGPLDVTITYREYPNSEDHVSGPHRVTATTEQIDPDLIARSIKMKLEWNSAPAAGRMGEWRYDVRDTGISR